MSQREVTIYVPCYNAAAHIDRCIKSLLAQTFPVKEILVINDGSTDDSMDRVRKYPQVRIIEHEGNKGLGVARNTALKNITTEFVANIDSDCVAEPDWLERLMDNMLEGKIAGVGSMLIESNRETVPDYWRVIHMKQHWGALPIRNPQWLYGHSAVFRRSALMAVGGYLDKYRTNYEDLDISRRLRAAGFDLVYEPKAKVYHLRKDTAYTVIRTRWRWTSLGVHGPITPWEIMKNQGRNLIRMTKYTLQDLIHFRFSLLGLDFALGFYSIYADMRSIWHR